jgi:hypothetical protein
LEEEHRLKAFEKRVMGRMYRRGIKWWEVGKIAVELRNLYTAPNIIRAIKSSRMIWTEHNTTHGDMEIWDFCRKVGKEETTKNAYT